MVAVKILLRDIHRIPLPFVIWGEVFGIVLFAVVRPALELSVLEDA